MTWKLIFVSFLVMILLSGTALAGGEDLPDPGMLLDSPFYFLKTWGEGIVTFFTFDNVAKAERFIYLAEKRLAEAKALAEKGKSDSAQITILRYQEHLEKALAKAREAKEKGLDTDEVLAKVSEATLKHLTVLADVYEQVPDEAKPAIQKAMEKSIRGNEEALKAVSGQKREEVLEKSDKQRQDVEKRLNKLREEGVPIPETRSSESYEVPQMPEDQPSGPQR